MARDHRIELWKRDTLVLLPLTLTMALARIFKVVVMVVVRKILYEAG